MIYLTDKHFFTFSLMNNSQRHFVMALSSFIHSFCSLYYDIRQNAYEITMDGWLVYARQ